MDHHSDQSYPLSLYPGFRAANPTNMYSGDENDRFLVREASCLRRLENSSHPRTYQTRDHCLTRKTQGEHERTESSDPTRPPSYSSPASTPSMGLVEQYTEDNGGNPFGDNTNALSRRENPRDPAAPSSGGQEASPSGWEQRQAIGVSRLRRYPTRKIKLVQGTVLSVDYPVPSAIRNAVESQYSNYSGISPEEITHLRCKPHRKHSSLLTKF